MIRLVWHDGNTYRTQYMPWYHFARLRQQEDKLHEDYPHVITWIEDETGTRVTTETLLNTIEHRN